jgi:release factor glutamine methyltransferase
MGSPSPPATLKEALRAATGRLRAGNIETPGLDARLLLAAAFGLDQAAMLRDPDQILGACGLVRFESFITRRLAREPVSRIVRRRWFHGRELEIGPDTLDPRPETETLVEGVLATLRERFGGSHPALRILDLGTGTGAILVSLLAELPNARGVGTDISQAALDIAKTNAARAGVAERAEFVRSDWLQNVEGIFDVVVSNPPYIASGDIGQLDPEVAGYDPPAALDGGLDGLDAYRRIIARVADVLADNGLVALEVGAGQASDVTRLCRELGRLVPLAPSARWLDLSGHLRCVAAVKQART